MRGTENGANSFIRFDILTDANTPRSVMYLHSVCVLTIRWKGEMVEQNGERFIRVFARVLAPWKFFYPRIYRFFSYLFLFKPSLLLPNSYVFFSFIVISDFFINDGSKDTAISSRFSFWKFVILIIFCVVIQFQEEDHQNEDTWWKCYSIMIMLKNKEWRVKGICWYINNR